jgi:hypothetical protein
VQAATPVADTSDADTIICRKLDPPTGSLIGERKVCKTKAEWDAIRKEAQGDLDNASRTTGAGSCTTTAMPQC